MQRIYLSIVFHENRLVINLVTFAGFRGFLSLGCHVCCWWFVVKRRIYSAISYWV